MRVHTCVQTCVWTCVGTDTKAPVHTHLRLPCAIHPLSQPSVGLAARLFMRPYKRLFTWKRIWTRRKLTCPMVEKEGLNVYAYTYVYTERDMQDDFTQIHTWLDTSVYEPVYTFVCTLTCPCASYYVVQMSAHVDVHIFGNMSVCRRLNMPACQCLNMPVCQCLNMPACQCLNMPACHCLNMPGCWCLNMPGCRRLNMPACWCLHMSDQHVEAHTCTSMFVHMTLNHP